MIQEAQGRADKIRTEARDQIERLVQQIQDRDFAYKQQVEEIHLETEHQIKNVLKMIAERSPRG
jgi:vacuolar-type H+-ATPase subunit H